MISSPRMRTLLGERGDVVVFLTALVFRLIWIATLENRLNWFDEREFAAIARHLADGDGYVSSSFRANPTVAVYLALVFRFFGENYAVARIGQSLMGAAACVFVARTARALVGPAAGLFSGFLLAMYPPHIFLSGVFYVDTWLTFFCALTVYLTVQIAQGRGGLAMALVCGVSQGLTMLTRPAFIAFLPGPMLAWMVSEAPLRARRALICGVFVLGAAATVLPWAYRNDRIFGRPMIASGFWVMLWRGNHELANGGADDRLLHWGTPTWEERLQTLPEERQRELRAEYAQLDRRAVERSRALGDADLALDDVLRPLAIDAIMSHPGRTVRLVIKKVGTLFSAFTETSSTNEGLTETGDHAVVEYRWLATLSFYPLLAMAAAGAVLGWPRRRELAPIYFLIVSVTGTYALLTACTRFRLPLDPFLIVLSSLAVARIVEALRRAPVAAIRSDSGAVSRAAPAAVASMRQDEARFAVSAAPRRGMPLRNGPNEGTNHV